MTNDEIIDKVLTRGGKMARFPFFELYKEATGFDTDITENLTRAKSVQRIMNHHNLLEEIGFPYVRISGYGIQINAAGGWLQHLGQ